jgi:eukaryotic-like serine/threonine-protein kinase
VTFVDSPESSYTLGGEGHLTQVGRYELGQLLGVGGMAEVYKATHTLPGGGRRTVVVKRILPVLSHNAAFMRLFVAEAQVLGLLHHPNVVQAYDFGESDGALFLVLEYVEGPSVSSGLLHLRAAGQRMPPVAAAHFASEVCRALEYVHGLKGGDGEALNIIHRDVTPSNIVLTLSGGIKLLDFGVAKYRASQARTLEGTIKGKAAYVAPETLEGKPIDHRVDIFSLGIVLHEMLTLQSLFESDNQALTFRKILELPIAPPSASRPAIPPELDAIVMKALERDPEQRYATASAMADDLDRFLADNGLRMDHIATFVRGLHERTAKVDSHRTSPIHPQAAPPVAVQPPKRPEPRTRFLGGRLGRLLFGGPRAPRSQQGR